MKNRILQILEKYQLTPSRFADEIGAQRSSISHILAERNKPSLEIVQRILNCYTAINAEWLLLGIGSMLKTENENLTVANSSASNLELQKKEQLELFTENLLNTTTESNTNDLTFIKNKNSISSDSSIAEENAKDKSSPGFISKTLSAPEIEKVILIYKDKTFEVLHGKS